VKRRHAGTLRARKQVGTEVSGRRQACPAQGLPRQQEPSQARSWTEPLPAAGKLLL